MKTLKPILYIFLITSIFSCEEANPIIELPPVEEEIISSDTYCVIEEESIAYNETFYTHNTGEQEHGFATATKINKEWESSAWSKISNNIIRVVMKTYYGKETSPFYVREILSIRLSHLEKGCYTGAEEINQELNEKHALIAYGTTDGDVFEDKYDIQLDDPLGNYVEIDSINFEANFISGYFNSGFDNIETNPKEWNPDYVRFLNGRFECSIID